MKQLIFFSFVIVLLSSCVQHSQDAIEHRDLQIDLKKSLDYLNEIAENSTNPDVYYQRASIYFQLAEPSKGLVDINQAINLKAESSEYFLLKGKIEQQLDKPEQAIESLLVAEKLGARQQELYEILASEYLQLNEVSKAKAAVDGLIALQPDGSSYGLKGDVLLAIGDSVNAIKSYQQAISKNTKLKDVYMKLAAIYSHRSENEKAGRLLNAYLAYDTIDQDVLLQKSRLLAKMSEYDSSKHIYRYLLKQDSSQFTLLYELSDLYYASSEYDSSAYFAEKVLALNRDFSDAQIVLARSLDRLRKYQEAIGIYESVLQKDSTHNLALQELDNLERKVAYLWRLEKQRKARDSARINQPPVVKKKQIEN